jgi:hypothetical protein
MPIYTVTPRDDGAALFAANDGYLMTSSARRLLWLSQDRQRGKRTFSPYE